ncbi:hypothetical protein PFISCL1PPCAC_9026, partial [Pristionchus fissidentatus]
DVVFWFISCLLLTLLTIGASILCFFLAPPLFPPHLTVLIFLSLILIDLNCYVERPRRVISNVLSVAMLFITPIFLVPHDQNKGSDVTIAAFPLFCMVNAGVTLVISGPELVNYQKQEKEIDGSTKIKIALAFGLLAIMVSSISYNAEKQNDRVG